MWPRLVNSRVGCAELATWWTEGPQHAQILAAEARRQGFDRVLAVGGDGTNFEILNGLWWEEQGRLPSLGLVPCGNGCDYARNFFLGKSRQEQLATAMGEHTAAVDVGFCRLVGSDGRPLSRVFFNVVGFGFDSAVIERLQHQRSRLGGRLAYILASLREMAQARCCQVQGALEGESIQAEALILAAGLGRSFGGGMRITPGAGPVSGRFQVVWGERLSGLELLGLLFKIYRGRHLNHPKVDSRYVRRLQLTVKPPAGVEAEGELIGKTPIALELYPHALRIACKGLR